MEEAGQTQRPKQNQSVCKQLKLCSHPAFEGTPWLGIMVVHKCDCIPWALGQEAACHDSTQIETSVLACLVKIVVEGHVETGEIVVEEPDISVNYLRVVHPEFPN